MAITNGTISTGTLTGSHCTSGGGTISAVLAGSGSLTNTNGMLTLSGANTYTGITAITGGEINITADDNWKPLRLPPSQIN